MPDKFVTNLKVAGEIIKVKDENLNGTVNEIIDGTIDLPYVKRSGDTMTGEFNFENSAVIKSNNHLVFYGERTNNDDIYPMLLATFNDPNNPGAVLMLYKSGLFYTDIYLTPYFTITDTVDVCNKCIKNVSAPTDTNDAANKIYVDNAIQNNIPKATNAKLGGIKAEAATDEDIQDIRITPDGFLKTKPSGGGSNITVVQTTGQGTGDVMSQKATTDAINAIPVYVLPQANDTALGGIMAAPATELDTQDVRITPDGHLKTKASGETPPTVVQSTGQSTGDVMSQKAVTDELANKINTSQLADNTAQTPINPGDIAVYSTTNQTYNTDDVRATILVADPHSDMEAVNKRTNDTKLAKANIDDNFKRVTAVAGVNPGTESYHIITKTLGEIGEDRIPMYDANNDLLVPTTPTGNNGAASKNYVDQKITTEINNTEPTERTALPASGSALTDNSIYNISDANVVGTYQFVPPANNGWAHGYFKTAQTPAITFASGSAFVNRQPTFAANTKYEFDIYKNTWAFAKVVTM